MPGGAVADAAEPAAGQDDVLLQDALGAAADPEIDIADDAGAGPRGAVFAALAHRRNAGDELRFAERAEVRRSLGAVHLPAFEKHRAAAVGAPLPIFHQLLDTV